MRNPSTTTGTNVDSFRRLEVITGVGRRRRWSLEDKARIVAESLDPARTASAVARRYGLHPGPGKQSGSRLLRMPERSDGQTRRLRGQISQHDAPDGL